jgi:hypothetical protein
MTAIVVKIFPSQFRSAYQVKLYFIQRLSVHEIMTVFIFWQVCRVIAGTHQKLVCSKNIAGYLFYITM